MTSPTVVETTSSPGKWRALLPDRAPLLLLYVSMLVSLRIASPYFDAWQTRGIHLAIGGLIWNGVAVIVAMMAMMRMRIRYRVAILLLIEISRLYVTLQYTVLDRTAFLTSGDMFFLLRNQLAVDAVDFGFISLIGHVLTSLFGAFVAPRAPADGELERATQGSIAEWAYLAVLIGLVCMPQPKVTISLSQIIWEPFGLHSIPRLMFDHQCRLILSLMGLLVLALLRGWRFSLVMLVAIVAAALGSVVYFAMWDWPRRPLRMSAIYQNLRPMFMLTALQSLPFWVILRAAGYRLYSPRRWIGGEVESSRTSG